MYEDIKNLLSTNTYNFLREDEHLKDRIMLLTLGGSHAYGTNIEGSDVDIRGFFAPSKKEILCPRDFLKLPYYEQFEDKPTDTVLFSFLKIVRLLIECNPNVIEILGTRDDQIFHISKEGRMLRDAIDLFISQHAGHTFGGYANQQLRRMENALARDSYPQPEREKHILKTIEAQMYHLQDHYKPFSTEAIKLYTGESDREDFETEIFLDVDLSRYPLRDFKGIFSEMSNIVTEYGKLNKRNKKKDEVHLLKHAMHLIRLFIMGTEILEGKGVNTYRVKDLDLLMSIRKGLFSYEEIFELAHQYEEKFIYAKKHSPLPEKPNLEAIEDLTIEINTSLLKVS